jgi:membrane-bound lytic murein transglycosylase F
MPPRRLRLLAPALVLPAALLGCDREERAGEARQVSAPAPPGAAQVVRDLAELRDAGRLTALLALDSTTYFVYRGEPLGFEYELLASFARDHALALDVEPLHDAARLVPALLAGEADVAAGRLVPHARPGGAVAYTAPLYETRGAVVQRERTPAEARISARRIDSPEDLRGEVVHLPRGSPYRRTLLELSDAVSGEPTLVEVERASAEALIRQVASGAIDLTVAAEDLALLEAASFREVVVEPRVGPPHPVTFAARRTSPVLLHALDRWIARQRESGFLETLHAKYFRNRRAYSERTGSRYLAGRTGRLSPWDGLFRRYAGEIGWDWRLLASMAYEESGFQAKARSWAGAVGLLQLMPSTARRFGAPDPTQPEQNVRAGAAYLQWLDEFWADEFPDRERRLPFVLGSYNAGMGHVADARALARKHGHDPDDWDAVAFWLAQKSRPRVYADPVVRFGYARGVETVNYVSDVLELWGHYRTFVSG